MSISPIIDAHYRLKPADLEGSARKVVVANVTYQGVEKMTPVLHFIGQYKRLVMSPEQVRQMLEITGTTLFQQWIGQTIILQPQNMNGESLIVLSATTSKSRAQPMPVYVPDDRRGWNLALLLVALLLIASMIYAAFNTSAILITLQQLRDNWLLR